MSAAGITYFLAVCFWALTAFYGVLSSQAFIHEQFLAPRLLAPLALFADWHALISVVALAGWGAARIGRSTRSGSALAAAIAWLAATAFLAAASPLTERLTTTEAMLVVAAGASLILLLAFTELQALRDAFENAPALSRDRSRADLAACLLAATGVTIAHAGAAAWLDGTPALLGSDVLHSLRLHFLLAAGAFLALSAVRSAAALTSRPIVTEFALGIAVLAAVLAIFISTTVLASISIRGPLATTLGLSLGLALACAVGARGAAERPGDGVVTALSALSPRLSAQWWGFALWLACLLVLTVTASTASRAADWNFVLLRSGVVVSWLLALSSALSLSHRFADGGAKASFAFVALLLGAHAGLQSAVAPVHASALRNASAKWLAEALEGGVTTMGARDLVRLLHAQTNIPRDTHVAAVDVQLRALTGGPSAARPHVFMLVVDSLRRDYLSPYNSAVTFTPAIDALAQDSLVFRNAFTQYGATGLSVPSIWVGGQILHKQYVTSFPRMNTLAKLLAHEQYDQWISMDNILSVILPPSGTRTPLDGSVAVKDFRMCRTLAEIRSRLAGRPATAPPVFAYSLPQDVHVSVVASEGARPIDDRDYSGFYAPVASRIRRFDECVGEFIRDLKARGMYEQSVIILTSDHGDSLGEEGRMGHAYSLHPEIVRVPLIVHLPAALRTAWTWDERRAAFSTDITPTLYRLLGHEPTRPASFFGDSLARRPDAPASSRRPRMVAASYGAVYGAVLDEASRYYVFDAIAMREMAFTLSDGPQPGAAVTVTPDIQEQGLKVIRETVEAIGTFYRFSPTPDSGS